MPSGNVPEVNIINSFKRRKVDGIIVRAIGRPNEKLYKELSIPMVSLYKVIGHKNIIISSEEGGAQVARHFLRAQAGCVWGIWGLPVPSMVTTSWQVCRQGWILVGCRSKKILPCNQHETAENQKAYQIFYRISAGKCPPRSECLVCAQ